MLNPSGLQSRRQGRGPWSRAGLLACLALAACEVPKEVSPVQIVREISGAADANRLPPPGLDQPFPNLSSVPPRPERPPAATREAISAALREDRASSRGPLVLRAVPGLEAAGAAPGEPVLPPGPPPRPALAAAPRVPWNEATPAAPRPGAPPRPGGVAPEPAAAAAPPAPPLPDMPAEAPAPPPPDLLGIPAPPGPDLLAPPRSR